MRRLVGEDFYRLFASFEHTAFRLEALDRYTVPDEDEQYRRFLADEPLDNTYMKPWLDIVADLATAGKRMQRVRVATEPLGDYLRFQFTCGYPYDIEAGEDIRILGSETAQALGVPRQDFWLFDSRQLARMYFDAEGHFLGAELVDEPATVVRHCYWRDAALHYAVPYQRYVAERLLLGRGS